MDDCALCNTAPVEQINIPTAFGVKHTCTECAQAFGRRLIRAGPSSQGRAERAFQSEMGGRVRTAHHITTKTFSKLRTDF